VGFVQGPPGTAGTDTAVYAKECCWTVLVVAGGWRVRNEEGHAVRGCMDRACRVVIVKEREFVINFSFECVCTGGA